MKNKKQVKPKWFNGVVYQEGTTVQNPFSGESYKLTEDLYKGLDWFRSNNAKAYMVLLD